MFGWHWNRHYNLCWTGMFRYPKVSSLLTILAFSTYKGVSLPDISFTAVELLTQSQTVYYFICKTDLQFYGCSVEFLLNGRTFDDMRFADNICYNKDGRCAPNTCSCSDSCKQFEWNLTSISNIGNITFGCGARIEEDQLVYKANISLVQKFGVFKITQKNVAVISGKVPYHESSTTTERREFTTARPNDNDILILTTFAVTVCIAIMLVVFIVCCIVFHRKISKPEVKYTTKKDTFPTVMRNNLPGVKPNKCELQSTPADLNRRYPKPISRTDVDQQHRQEPSVIFYSEKTGDVEHCMPVLTNLDSLEQNKNSQVLLNLESLSSQFNSRGRRATISSVSTGISSQEALLKN